MSGSQLLTRVRDNIENLPGDIFSVKRNFLQGIADLAEQDLESAVVKLGKAGERLAKGCLEYYAVSFNENDSFDYLIKCLASVSPSPTLIVGLRTVLKYRNQAAHDNPGKLSVYDLDAATSSFCAAYQAAVGEMRKGSPGEDPGREVPVDTGTGRTSLGTSRNSASGAFSGMEKKIGLLCLVTAGFLLWAAARGGSYNFFILLRIIVTTTSVAAVITSFKNSGKSWIVFLGTALLFNPVLPIYLTRGIWVWIDLTAALLFLTYGLFLIKKSGGFR
jgi:hypothetical protein